MPAVLVQKASASGNVAVDGLPPSVTLNGVQAGNFLTVQLSIYVFSQTSVPTDVNGTWNSAGNTGVGGANVFIGYQGGVNGGIHTATSSNPLASGWTITMCEWSDVGSTTAVDIATGTTAATAFQPSYSVTVPAQTLSQADELVLGTFSMADSNGISNAAVTDPPSEFTSLAVQNDSLPQSGQTNGNIAEHCYIASNGSTALPATTWNANNSGFVVYYDGFIVTFATKPADNKKRRVILIGN